MEKVDYRDQIKTKKDLMKMSAAIKKMGLDEKVGSMNNALKIVYGVGIDAELKTFNMWKKEGLSVKKGSKAYTFWSRPLKGKKKEEEGTEGSEGKFQFFGMCKLFAKCDVEIREPKEKKDKKKKEVA